MIRAVPLDAIDECWPIVAPMLEPALQYHPHIDIDDLRTIALADRGALFVFLNERISAAFMLERVQYPKHAVANMLAIGGRFGTLEHIASQVIPYWTAWAASHGCDRISAIGREGWLKTILGEGAQPVRLVMGWKQVEV